MNRIEKKFRELKKQGKKAFIPYITAGDPDIGTTEKLIHVLASSGADIIELGIPFSDPLADGPTIQKAIKRSLDNGCSAKKVMAMVKRIRERNADIPLVFMTYYNIVFTYGVDRFVGDARGNGADGLIVPDLPMEESENLGRSAEKNGLNLIMLAAPTTPLSRIKKIANLSRGFLYYVSLTGVTGARKAVSERLKKEVKKIKKNVSIPVCVGFGISDPSQAKDIAEVSDGVIIGSAIIKKIENNLTGKKKMMTETGKFSKALSGAVHKIRIFPS